MLTDSFFVQGTTHEVCEDYAVHGGDYAIISDGCSNAGGPRIHTDFGSRILTKAAEEHIYQDNVEAFLQGVSATSRTQQRAFPNLPDACLTATLGTLRKVGDSHRALLVGDGVVGGRRRDGRWKIHVVEFPGGPYYLKYQMFGETPKWIEQFGQTYKIHTYFGNIRSPEMEFPEWADQPPSSKERMGAWSNHVTFSTQEQNFSVIKPYNEFVFPADDYEFTFICSDGPEAFYIPVKSPRRKYNEPVCVLDVLRVLLDFVTVRPGFARLQSNWVFRQDKAGTFRRRNWLNGDDVAVGVIHENPTG